jgi:hypothetical protein
MHIGGGARVAAGPPIIFKSGMRESGKFRFSKNRANNEREARRNEIVEK